ncbi:MAG: putative metalloprotease with PDZ domain [Planctomycetota bacterium]|jgi:predicted metalloprotease with PDZ domain
MTRIMIALVALAASALSQTMRDDMTPMGLAYELKVLEDTQTLEIQVAITNAKRNRTHVAMPNWTPGSYRPQEFGKWVSDVTVVDSKTKNEVAFEQIDLLTWSIDTSSNQNVTVTYRITPRRRRFTPVAPKADRIMTGMHIEGPATFMYVKGHERGTPVTCLYRLPKSWKVANGMLFGKDPYFRHAADYDTFVDCPTIMGIFSRVHFKVEETPFSCVFWDPTGEVKWDIKKFSNEVVKPIVTEQGRVFGSFPFPRYVFLFTVSPGGGGGLEHLSSTSIGLNTRAMTANVMSGAGITAHEFFHTWNVKRIRPAALGPFNYRQENYTGNLWVCEGWTSYYGDLSMTRLGMQTPERYLRGITGGINRAMSNPNRKEHSVFWASRDIWHRGRVSEKSSRVDYYSYGELLGLLLDVKIRHETDSKKSLDDVMRFLNRWFAEKNVGFEEDDIERACTAISNYDFSEFFARYVYGTMVPPFAEIFDHAGLEYKSTTLSAELPFFSRSNEDGLQVRASRRSRREAGLKRGDMIVKIDGEKVTDSAKYLMTKNGSEKVVFTVRREGKTETEDITIELVKRNRTSTTLTPMSKPSAKQKRIYDNWMRAH